MMFRSAMNRIDAHSETTAMIGDRMDTDVVAGMEAGLRTFLVLTGSTRREDVDRYPYRPSVVVHVGRGPGRPRLTRHDAAAAPRHARAVSTKP